MENTDRSRATLDRLVGVATACMASTSGSPVSGDRAGQQPQAASYLTTGWNAVYATGPDLARKRAYVLDDPLAAAAIQQLQPAFGDLTDGFYPLVPGQPHGGVPVSQAVDEFLLGDMQRPRNCDHLLAMVNRRSPATLVRSFSTESSFAPVVIGCGSCAST